jgi:uncharacterized protein (DUF1684 family)
VDDYRSELEYERTMKDQFMARHAESPFIAGGVSGFRGLRYFPIDTKYRVRSRLERRAVPEEAFLRTNRDGQATMRLLGDLVFRLGGRELRLRIYHAGEGVGTSAFVPFRDATSGTDSYGAGRYLTLELNESDEYELDFNRAFNPYCAYTDAYECGFPPAENDLPVPVRAGEKVWDPDRNPSTPNTAVRELLTKPVAKKAPPAKAAARRKVRPSRKSGSSAQRGPRKAPAARRSVPKKRAARRR